MASQTATDPDAAADGSDPVTHVYRSVSPQYGPHGNGSMDAIGVLLFGGLLLLMLPLLPVIVTMWFVSKAAKALTGQWRGE
jgi:hypothetical protein